MSYPLCFLLNKLSQSKWATIAEAEAHQEDGVDHLGVVEEDLHAEAGVALPEAEAVAVAAEVAEAVEAVEVPVEVSELEPRCSWSPIRDSRACMCSVEKTTPSAQRT